MTVFRLFEDNDEDNFLAVSTSKNKRHQGLHSFAILSAQIQGKETNNKSKMVDKTARTAL